MFLDNNCVNNKIYVLKSYRYLYFILIKTYIQSMILNGIYN